MRESYKSELKKTVPNLVKCIIFFAISPFAGIVAGIAGLFIPMFLAACIATVIGLEDITGLAPFLLLLALFLGCCTFFVFIVIGAVELIKFKKHKKHNANVLEQYKDVIAAEKQAEKEKRRQEEEKRRQEEEMRRYEEEKRRYEEEKLKEQHDQQAASANNALNSLLNPNSVPAVAPISNNTSSFVQGTTGLLLYELDGQVVNVLQIYEDRCVIIAKTTARSYIAGKFFNGTKEFFYDDLTNVQFREATKNFNGYLQFDYPGAVNISSAQFGGSSGNYSSENSFIFSPNCVPKEMIYSNESVIDATNRIVGSMYQYMHKRIREEKAIKKNGNSSNAAQTVSAADELAKYHNLLEKGVITQDEFQAMKKQLFG